MKKYPIGTALKKQRINMNLTQGDFTQGILSISQYSRVESGKQDIKASDLINILTVNHIDINRFFSSITITKNFSSTKDISNEKIMLLLMQGFYDHNPKPIYELKKSVLKYDPKNQLLNLIDLVIAVLEKRTDSLPKNIITFFSNNLNKSDNWVSNEDFLKLFGNTMVILNIDRLNIYMHKILKFYKNDIQHYSITIQKRIAGICINYLKISTSYKYSPWIKDTLSLINNLSPIPELFMFKLLGLYFKNIFTNNPSQNKEILDLLSNCGYNNFIKNLF